MASLVLVMDAIRAWDFHLDNLFDLDLFGHLIGDGVVSEVLLKGGIEVTPDAINTALDALGGFARCTVQVEIKTSGVVEHVIKLIAGDGAVFADIAPQSLHAAVVILVLDVGFSGKEIDDLVHKGENLLANTPSLN